MTLRILICDDHAAVRAGLTAALQLEVDFEVVGEASDGAAAVERATALRPDVIIIDHELPVLDGSQATERILTLSPRSRVLLLTGYEREHLLRKALAAGATGFVLKSAAVAELVFAVRSVGKGHTYVDPRMVKHLVKEAAGPFTKDPKPALSAREHEVLRLSASGLVMKEIAARLDIGVRTIEAYKERGMKKLGLTTRAELVAHAVANDWLRQA